MYFLADYYDGKTTKRYTVTVTVTTDRLLISGDGINTSVALKAIMIEGRVGHNLQNIILPNWGRLETGDFETIAILAKQLKKLRISSVVSFMETSIKTVIFSSAILLLLIVLFLQFGIPAVSKATAFALPPSTATLLGNNVLEILDNQLFEPTKLDTESMREVTDLFSTLTRDLPKEIHYTLLFRNSPKLGANAFALPNGTIILTDDFVHLANEPEELLAVMAHEAGHVVNRHALRTVLQNSLITLAAVIISGDLSSIAVSAPTLFIENKYSRDFEREADDYAVAWMNSHAIPVQHFATILEHLSDRAKRHSSGSLPYLSTHPDTTERIKRILSSHKQIP